jgi:hypothetical protein
MECPHDREDLGSIGEFIAAIATVATLESFRGCSERPSSLQHVKAA